jgi:hypothetical protein
VWARHEKSRRLQLAVADNPAVATSLAILGLLNSSEVGIRAMGGFAPDDRFANPPLEQLGLPSGSPRRPRIRAWPILRCAKLKSLIA